MQVSLKLVLMFQSTMNPECISTKVVSTDTNITMDSTNQLIKSVYEDGYWWVVISDELWETAELMEYFDGYPIYGTWTKKS